MNINPIKLSGNWDCGWALDIHTVSSVYLGEDPFGHARFKSVRSEMGEKMFQLKYADNYRVLSEVADTVVGFLHGQKIDDFDAILPVPPSKDRNKQPVFSIAEAVAERIEVFYTDNVLVKTDNTEAKSMSYADKDSLTGTIVCRKKAKRPCNILLIDDIYETGSTLRDCVRALREDSNIKNIYVITMTKTRNK